MTFKKIRICKVKKDFINNDDKKEKLFKIKKSVLISRIVLGFFGIFCLACVFFAVIAKMGNFTTGLNIISSFIPGNDLQLESGKEKINILLVGMGGAKNDAPDLTDTIILASLNLKEKTISMFSIPRDLYVSYPNKFGAGKINELYLLGKKKYGQEEGIGYLKSKVTEITGEDIDYHVMIDFEGFIKFIDVLGGVKVDVPEDLVDTSYPDWKRGYVTFSVKKGLQTFDGETALKYVRSRHSTNDFDRSIRQQLVIKAVRDKIFSLEYLTSPTKIKNLYYVISSNINSNLNLKQIVSLATNIKGMQDNKSVLSFNLNDTCIASLKDCQKGSFLYFPRRDLFAGISVVLPEKAVPGKISYYTDIQKFADLAFNYPKFFSENQEISIINTTKQSSLAYNVALKLKKYGFNIPGSDYLGSTKENLEETKIYFQWNEETKSGIDPNFETLKVFENLFNIKPIGVKESTYFTNSFSKIVIVLGKDYNKYFN
ncbi:MAG: LCP family protein [Candidatus Gracilibacteria bacterium]|nr:LCP family protein [Candidatus Gracilibacteria bacterium]